MAILIGLIFLAIGISLAVTQWAAFVAVLQAVVALGLLFCGGILVLVGYSEMKARREYASAITTDEPQPEQHDGQTSNNTALATPDKAL